MNSSLIKKFELKTNTMKNQNDILNLLKNAISAREKAYAKYSKFKVGSAILSNTNNLYHGCNIENSSYGATICAERVALYTCIASGDQNVTAIAIIADHPTPIQPCGICLQVLSEFDHQNDMIVIMANLRGDLDITTLSCLIPKAFSL